MKRYTVGLLSIIFALCGPLTASASTSTNTFTYTSFHADYYLGADKEGRSTLKTVETLTAVFPNKNQPYVVQRNLAENYDGHPTNLQIVSVTNQSGARLSYKVTEAKNEKIVSLEHMAQSNNERQIYVITYTQRDVTKYVASVAQHEFAWDATGDQLQAVQSASVIVHMDANISPTLNKKVVCTRTYQGSSQECMITEQGETVTASAQNLKRGENMAFSIGFTAGTFRGYQPALSDQIVKSWPIAVFVIVLLVVIIIWLSVRFGRQRRRRR